MDSRSLWGLIRYQWPIIVLCVLLGGGAGLAAAMTATPEYTARAEVFVMVTGGSSTGEVAQSTNYSQQQARNFSIVATREVVLEPVLEELELDLSLADLREMVSTSVPLNSTLIAISVTHPSADEAAEIANAVAARLEQVVPELTPSVDDRSPVQLQLVETANPPAFPSAPNRTLFVALGLMGGLVLAAVLVVLRGILLARVRTKAQVTEITGANVIGSITRSRSAYQYPMALTSDAQSIRAEEYRQLRANLRFLQVGERKAFVVTSSIPSEGKSSTAANLAAALAASGQSVCLVEADLRRPSLSDVLDLPSGVGFTSVLMGESTLDDALVTWGTDGLEVLLAGDFPPNPSELLESEAAVEVFERLRARFDVLIIDSPPLNPVADAAVLAGLFESVILVVGAGRARVSDLRRATDRLAAVGASVEGAVLTFATGTETGGYRYGYAPTASGSRRSWLRSRSSPGPLSSGRSRSRTLTPVGAAGTAVAPPDDEAPTALHEVAGDAPDGVATDLSDATGADDTTSGASLDAAADETHAAGDSTEDDDTAVGPDAAADTDPETATGVDEEPADADEALERAATEDDDPSVLWWDDDESSDGAVSGTRKERS